MRIGIAGLVVTLALNARVWAQDSLFGTDSNNNGTADGYEDLNGNGTPDGFETGRT